MDQMADKEPVATENRTYVVGCIKPTRRPQGTAEMAQLLPPEIRVDDLYLGFARGTMEEFREAMDGYGPKVAAHAEAGVDLIHPEGAPPFMIHGYQGEQEILGRWNKTYGVPVFTSGTTQVAALKALGVKKFAGATYYVSPLNQIVTDYFTEAGFEVMGMQGLKVEFQKVRELSDQQVLDHVVGVANSRPEADAIYMLGSAWPRLSIVEELEDEIGKPVLHPMQARCWYFQKLLGLKAPIRGYGRLMAEIP